MTNSPKAIHAVAVLAVDEKQKSIKLTATADFIEVLRERAYGRLYVEDSTGECLLYVSPLYAFEEVERWIEDQAA